MNSQRDSVLDFEALWRSVRPQASRILGRYAISTEDAQDLLHESALIFLRKLRSRFEFTSPEGYLLGILRWQCVTHWRKVRSRAESSLEEVGTPHFAIDPSVEAFACRRDLVARLSLLSPRARKILLLRHYYGYETRIVAAAMALRPGSVRKVCQRAKLALRAAEGHHGDEASRA